MNELISSPPHLKPFPPHQSSSGAKGTARVSNDDSQAATVRHHWASLPAKGNVLYLCENAPKNDRFKVRDYWASRKPITSRAEDGSFKRIVENIQRAFLSGWVLDSDREDSLLPVASILWSLVQAFKVTFRVLQSFSTIGSIESQ